MFAKRWIQHHTFNAIHVYIYMYSISENAAKPRRFLVIPLQTECSPNAPGLALNCKESPCFHNVTVGNTSGN